MRSRASSYISVILFVVAVSPCAADITAIGPFTGDKSENFDSFQWGLGGHTFLDIFGGDVTLHNRPGGSVKIEKQSTRGGDTVNFKSPESFAGQFQTMDWFLHRPIDKFGGYFENNSRFDDIVVQFFDINDQLIGTRTAVAPKAAQVWTWNGWQSDVPIHRITTAGNDVDFLNGFVWYEDMEISFSNSSVPEPSSCALLCTAIALLVAKRRRRALCPIE